MMISYNLSKCVHYSVAKVNSCVNKELACTCVIGEFHTNHRSFMQLVARTSKFKIGTNPYVFR